MYDKLDVYTMFVHVIFEFLEFSRNHLGGDEPPSGNTSIPA